ncbi:pyridine nucleotide-disulfide oxidoreductase [Exiguobacterium sp. SL-10]|uniref:NAD(P)/FAD-dependent oxidoreductase n=1 Tax=Exiguobacterium sp. SL-10 TaxID=2510962 RepID=UPI001038F02F|nr:FAD-dependent oxidoreductase [Exiguobacterium sp. SL-10]TCI29467.1 pyridine nucleotide-disulfide oxidoreductase [Exiguobacterium sp. SL-10]
MKPRLVLVGLGHGQFEILEHLDRLREYYEVSYIGGREAIYTGAFPQVIAGEMASATTRLRRDIAPVAERLIALDPDARLVETEHGNIAYDFLVLSTGAKSRGIGTGLKPMTRNMLDEIVQSDAITIVGGGKAGVELAFACIRRKRHVTLYARDILPDLSHHVGRQMARRLVQSGVTLMLSSFQPGTKAEGLVLDATGVGPDDWWAAAGLADHDAFIETTADLRHPVYREIYITGDMAARLNGGVDAVRSGRHVARQLLGTSRPFKSRTSLNILLTTPGRALLTFGKLTWHGRLPYWLKRKIDRRHVERFN